MKKRRDVKGLSNKELAKEQRASAWAWELWSRGDRYDEPMFIAAYADKGLAKERMQRLKRSNPYASYMLKHRRVPVRHLHEGRRGTRRAQAAFSKRMGW